MTRLVFVVVLLYAVSAHADFILRQNGTKVGPVNEIDCGTNMTCSRSGNRAVITSSGGGGGGAPTTVDYLVRTANGTLSAERVVTDNTYVQWDWSAAGVVKAVVLTADALAANPADCGSNQFCTGTGANAACVCAQPGFGNLSGNIAVSQLNGGSGAANNTFFRGDNSWSQVQFSQLSGSAGVSQGGTGNTTSTEDAVLIGVGSSAYNKVVIPDCDDSGGNHLNYDQGTNTLSCGTSSSGGGGGAPTGAQYWTGTSDGTLSSEHNLGALGTGLVINTSGTPSAYAGTSCTNQFPRSLNASGAATCSAVSVANDVTGTLGVGNGGTSRSTTSDDGVLVGDSSSAYSVRTLPSCSNATTSKLLYDDSTNTFSCGTDQTGGGGSGPTVLASNVAVAVNATYVQVFSVTPGTSADNGLYFTILHTCSVNTVGVQFRVRSDDTGNVGNCDFAHLGVNGNAASTTLTTLPTAPIAIGAAPADDGSLACRHTALNKVEIFCQFTSDGTPGAVILEAQLESGTTSINVLAGSMYTLVSG